MKQTFTHDDAGRPETNDKPLGGASKTAEGMRNILLDDRGVYIGHAEKSEGNKAAAPAALTSMDMATEKALRRELVAQLIDLATLRGRLDDQVESDAEEAVATLKTLPEIMQGLEKTRKEIKPLRAKAEAARAKAAKEAAAADAAARKQAQDDAAARKQAQDDAAALPGAGDDQA